MTLPFAKDQPSSAGLDESGSTRNEQEEELNSE